MKDLKPILTTFNVSRYPKNLFTVEQWRRFGKELRIKGHINAARKYAELKGGAFIAKDDGKLIVLTKLSDGTIRTNIYNDKEWIFEEV